MVNATRGLETERLTEAREQDVPWRKWGPYLSERQWGTVREDYSDGGDAWNYFTHDQARSRAYHWGEDGLAGVSDEKQRLCFALALWNEQDPILKERLFGLTNSEGNHGEDVKEYYFYLDSTPTHSYMKWLYKYPQREFPYARLADENRRRGRGDREFELVSRNPGRARDFVEGLRRQIRRYIDHNFSPETAALMNALVVGEMGGITREMRSAYTDAGVNHVLSISGLHVAMLGLVVFTLIRFAPSLRTAAATTDAECDTRERKRK